MVRVGLSVEGIGLARSFVWEMVGGIEVAGGAFWAGCLWL